jgi:hypothetical protein
MRGQPMLVEMTFDARPLLAASVFHCGASLDLVATPPHSRLVHPCLIYNNL